MDVNSRWIIISISVFIMISVLIVLCFFKGDMLSLLGEKIQIHLPTGDPSSEFYHFSNNYQYNSPVWMGENNGQWYMFVDGTLYEMNEDGLTMLQVLETTAHARKSGSITIIGQSGQYLLYSKPAPSSPDDHRKQALCYYDLQLHKIGTVTNLFERDLFVNGRYGIYGMDILDEDGTAYILMHSDREPCYLVVKDGVLTATANDTKGFRLGESVYTVLPEKIEEFVYQVGADGKEEALILPYGSRRTVIPAANGLVIHNEEYGSILWFIDENEKLSNIFSFECMFCESCVAVHDTYAFLSFKRWERYDDIYPQRFKNDTIEGTWRIDLKDFSTLKISNQIYKGMFIFNGSSICGINDEGEIEQIDFEGNLLTRVLDK